MSRAATSILLCAATLYAGVAAAQDVRITEDRTEVKATVNGTEIAITRIQNQDNTLTGEFARTSRACPPFCIQSMQVAAGVETVGELEVLDFIQGPLADGSGLLIDARLPEFFNQGAIPGAVNLPFATIAPENPYRDQILMALGAKDGDGGTLIFDDARSLLVYCNGAWSDQSVRAIRDLIAASYPAGKIFYYRGGMQDWLTLGLSVTVPAQ